MWWSDGQQIRTFRRRDRLAVWVLTPWELVTLGSWVLTPLGVGLSLGSWEFSLHGTCRSDQVRFTPSGSNRGRRSTESAPEVMLPQVKSQRHVPRACASIGPGLTRINTAFIDPRVGWRPRADGHPAREIRRLSYGSVCLRAQVPAGAAS